MRNADVYRLTRVLLPQLADFETNKKSEIFIVPIGEVLKGFLFDSSSYSKEDFYFSWFFMPIGRPIEYLTLNYGGRLNVPGGNSGWRTDMNDLPQKLLQAMTPNALPLLRSLNTIQDTIFAIYTHRKSIEQTEDDPNVLDDISCLQILDGQFDAAKLTLQKLIAHEYRTDRRQWILDIIVRAKGLYEKLIQDPQLAVNQVKEWQDFTFNALKLEKWR